MSSDGAYIAVGYGRPSAPGRSKRDGGFAILRSSDLSVVVEHQDSQDWVCELRFSPDSSLLAVSTQVRCCCDLYNVVGNCKVVVS